MPDRATRSGQADRNTALALWAAGDSLRREARQLREDADRLDREAARMDALASATADGRSLADA